MQLLAADLPSCSSFAGIPWLPVAISRDFTWIAVGNSLPLRNVCLSADIPKLSETMEEFILVLLYARPNDHSNTLSCGIRHYSDELL